MRTPDVELLWWRGCPSTERALADLREALHELGLNEASVRMREIRTDAEAGSEPFKGSPTVLIDGVDAVELVGQEPRPAAEPGGLFCRVYRRRDGRISPTPDPADLRDALRTAAEGAPTTSAPDARRTELPC
jgi:hypothetical protein